VVAVPPSILKKKGKGKPLCAPRDAKGGSLVLVSRQKELIDRFEADLKRRPSPAGTPWSPSSKLLATAAFQSCHSAAAIRHCCALAGLDHQGTKAAMIDDLVKDKVHPSTSEALMAAILADQELHQKQIAFENSGPAGQASALQKAAEEKKKAATAAAAAAKASKAEADKAIAASRAAVMAASPPVDPSHVDLSGGEIVGDESHREYKEEKEGKANEGQSALVFSLMEELRKGRKKAEESQAAFLLALSSGKMVSEPPDKAVPPVAAQSEFDKTMAWLRAQILVRANFGWEKMSSGFLDQLKAAALKPKRQSIKLAGGLSLQLSEDQDPDDSRVESNAKDVLTYSWRDFSDVYMHFVLLSNEIRPEETADKLEFYRWLVGLKHDHLNKLRFFAFFKGKYGKEVSWMEAVKKLGITEYELLSRTPSSSQRPKAARQPAQPRRTTREDDRQRSTTNRQDRTDTRDRPHRGGNYNSKRHRDYDRDKSPPRGPPKRQAPSHPMPDCTSVTDTSYNCRRNCKFNHHCSRCMSKNHTLGRCDK
jgi:hypothetical protein